ncbi:MAG: hypothetical protein L0154_04695 [Chloroflexi bacterium]|nr:hypothetical protein [Chloroflexota bacterium]
MLPKRLSVKIFAAEDSKVKPAAIMPVFQHWIQENTLEGLLIDVVDYKHVHHGPGIILIGHEGDYGLDFSEGRAGLLFTLKQNRYETLTEAVRESFRLAIVAAEKLSAETGITFNYGEAKITVLDRLNAPNTPETFGTVEAQLSNFASRVFDGDVSITNANADPRDPFAVTIQAEATPAIETLLEKLSLSLTSVS